MNTTDQLIAAVVAEHAAIFGYGAVGGRLSGSALESARQAEAAHRQRRDTLTTRLLKKQVTVPPAEPVYATPFTVSDQASALRLAALLEERTAQAWRSALPVTQGDDRVLAMEALVDAALRAARWRRASGESPAMVTFPGKP